jgi:hypothetical protein
LAAKTVHRPLNNPIIPEYANTQAQFLAKNINEITPQAGTSYDCGLTPPIGRHRELTSESLSLMQFGRTQLASSPWNDERVRVAMPGG